MAHSATRIKKEGTPDIDSMSVDEGDVKPKLSPSGSPALKDGGGPSPPPPTPSKAKSETPARNAKSGPLLIGDLPLAPEAMDNFEELQSNRYQYSTLGRSREALESMSCDCQFVPGEDDPDTACGDNSDCINRLTQVECDEGDCRCRAYCKNQRMQRREHANIEIVLTEKKGFGLRAASAIRKDAFIYEYIGDVVSQPTFAKRMRDYAAEGIRHFYFMMLQKDEFIDATKRGGIGRFANHSCNPNCFVAKWTVGKHVRMGIYAKRNIKKDEELTFNYNVDRYGHDAQPCYCGEPNCVGFLGGKTQTDVAAMDDLYLDALGITEEVEMYGLKGTKKKKGKKLDEDYVPVLKPLFEKEVPKVIQAVRQTQSRKVLLKLLTRMKITEDQSALRQLMRLRGYSLMCNILEDFPTDIEICTNVLECMSTWPLLQRNKIEDSKIEEPVQVLTKSENEILRSLAEKTLSHWLSLEVGYRIPKRLKAEGEDDTSPVVPEVYAFDEDTRTSKRSRVNDIEYEADSYFPRIKPLGRSQQIPFTSQPNEPNIPKEADRVARERAAQQNRARVIAEAARAAEEAREKEAAIAAAAKAKAEEEKKKGNSSREKSRKKQLSKEEKEVLKEKRLQKLVGAVVVKCMSKYRDQMNHDTFKKHAKELTQTISDKEKKSNSYQSGNLESLSEEKVTKIKKFAKDYIAKVLRRLEKSGSKRPPPSGGLGHEHTFGGSHASTSTPRSDTASKVHDREINLYETLDLGLDDYQDGDDDSGDPSPATDANGPEPAVAVVDQDIEMRVSDPRANRKFITPSASPVSGKGKHSRWDQGPPEPVTQTTSNHETLFAGL